MRFVATFLIAAGLVAGTAQAAIYENSIEVDSEDDIFELEQRGDISEDTSQTLMEMIREGVDLNSADREQLYDLPGLTYADVDAILEYRKLKGHIDDPSELVGANALTPEQLVAIAPFIRIDAAKPILPISGKFHAATRVSTTDNVPPPALLMARLKGPLNLSAGFMAFTTRRRAATPYYSDLVDGLMSQGFQYTPQLPRFFVQWKPGNARLVAGTFTLGFGERLTLDNSRRVTPRGIYLVDDYRRPQDLSQTCKLSNAGLLADPTTGCDPGDPNAPPTNLYITPDYTWRDVFRGVAGSIEDLKLGDEASMSIYGFASYQQRSIYQYQLYDRRYCDDPSDTSSECKAPPVYLPDLTTTLKYSTLNNAFNELTGGGHVTFKPSYRFTFGVTGWGAMPMFQQAPMQLDFQEYSRYPTGGPFGAIGVDAQTGYKAFNFFFEATHNFDNRVGTEGHGGYGAEQRTTWSPKGHEFELSLRFYDTGFGTPYSRPIASPDMLDGQRARNEAGTRFRWVAKWSRDWETRLQANFWVNPYADSNTPQAGVSNLYVLARVDFTGWKFFQPGIWIDMRNKNLPYSEHGTCSSGTVILTEGDNVTCGGDFYKFATRIEIAPAKRLIQGALLAAYTLKDDIRYKDRFRSDLLLWAEVRSQPIDFLQFRARVRYNNQDLEDPAYLEENLWTYFEGAVLISKGFRVSLRYDLLFWLDKRSSTPMRVPNPENRFQLDIRYAF